MGPDNAGDVAYLTNDISQNNFIWNSNDTVGEVYLGDANGTHSFRISSGRLIFDNLGAAGRIHQISTSAGDSLIENCVI
jgi:hypothetical protein